MVLLSLIENVLFLGYNFMRVIIFGLVTKYYSLIKRIVGSIISNTEDKSS